MIALLRGTVWNVVGGKMFFNFNLWLIKTSLHYSNEIGRRFNVEFFVLIFEQKQTIMMEGVFKLWLTDRKEEKWMLFEEVEGQEMCGKQKIGLEQEMGGEEEKIG